MDNMTLLRLENGSLDNVKNILNNFVAQHAQTFTFSELNQDDRRRKFWTLLFSHLDKPSSALCHKQCLSCVRMLSRDKTDLEELFCEKWLNILLYHAGLVPQEQALLMSSQAFDTYDVIVEALKCLCNLVYNCVKAQQLCSQNHSVEAVMTRLHTYKDPHLPHDIKYFDMKFLFLMTALCPEVRPRLKEELHGFTYLMEILDLMLKEAAAESVSDKKSHSNVPIILSTQQVNLVSEVLKVLFNITAHPGLSSDVDEDEEDAQYLRLESILHDYLLCETSPPDLKDTLNGHVVALLTAVPNKCHKQLMTVSTKDSSHKDTEFDGHNMEAVLVLLQFLDSRLEECQKGGQLHEKLTPILCVLHDCAVGNRVLRKFLRWKILPPLRDVHTRPEEGTSLRNKLCQLLTTPIKSVRDLVAELLFVLCKESVDRMIKYTGYGNAAGLFANRQLLAKNRPSSSSKYSSDDSDSDTEEYTQYRDQINPIIGCCEPPHPDPTAGMTDDQKEYEAVKLVNLMDKLHREGVIQPCRISDEGKPEPVSHVLELQEPLPQDHISNKKKCDDDEDDDD